jgi:hypothetical protein
MPVTIAKKNCILYKKKKRRHDASRSIGIRKKSPTAKGYTTIRLPPRSRAFHGFSVNNGAREMVFVGITGTIGNRTCNPLIRLIPPAIANPHHITLLRKKLPVL